MQSPTVAPWHPGNRQSETHCSREREFDRVEWKERWRPAGRHTRCAAGAEDARRQGFTDSDSQCPSRSTSCCTSSAASLGCSPGCLGDSRRPTRPTVQRWATVFRSLRSLPSSRLGCYCRGCSFDGWFPRAVPPATAQLSPEVGGRFGTVAVAVVTSK